MTTRTYAGSLLACLSLSFAGCGQTSSLPYDELPSAVAGCYSAKGYPDVMFDKDAVHLAEGPDLQVKSYGIAGKSVRNLIYVEGDQTIALGRDGKFTLIPFSRPVEWQGRGGTMIGYVHAADEGKEVQLFVSSKLVRFRKVSADCVDEANVM